MTKLIPAVLIALAATAGAAAAENGFSLNRAQSTASSLAFTDVQADQAGSVEVYTFDGENLGTFLGSAAVEAGANADLEVALSRPTNGRILVIMSNGNYAVSKLDTTAALTN